MSTLVGSIDKWQSVKQTVRTGAVIMEDNHPQYVLLLRDRIIQDNLTLVGPWSTRESADNWFNEYGILLYSQGDFNKYILKTKPIWVSSVMSRFLPDLSGDICTVFETGEAHSPDDILWALVIACDQEVGIYGLVRCEEDAKRILEICGKSRRYEEFAKYNYTMRKEPVIDPLAMAAECMSGPVPPF